MKEIRKTIASYQESIELVHGRIQELHQGIAKAGGEGCPGTQGLARRRHLLYRQLWEMQRAKGSLEEYVDCVTERKKHTKMGR